MQYIFNTYYFINMETAESLQSVQVEKYTAWLFMDCIQTIVCYLVCQIKLCLSSQ